MAVPRSEALWYKLIVCHSQRPRPGVDGSPESAVYSQPSVSRAVSCQVWACWALPYVHRNRRLIRDGGPGRPPRLSHSFWVLMHGRCRSVQWCTLACLTVKIFERIFRFYEQLKSRARKRETTPQCSTTKLTQPRSKMAPLLHRDMARKKRLWIAEAENSAWKYSLLEQRGGKCRFLAAGKWLTRK